MDKSEIVMIVTTVVTVIFSIAMFIAWPFILIWSLNTLFPVLNIPYTFYTWVASLVMAITPAIRFNSKSKSK